MYVVDRFDVSIDSCTIKLIMLLCHKAMMKLFSYDRVYFCCVSLLLALLLLIHSTG